MYVGAAPPNRAARVASRQSRVAARGAAQQARAIAHTQMLQARAQQRAAEIAEREQRRNEQRKQRALRSTVANAARGAAEADTRALLRSRPHPTLRMEYPETPHISPREERAMRMRVRPLRQGTAPLMERNTDELMTVPLTPPEYPAVINDPELLDVPAAFPPFTNEERRDIAFAAFRPTGVRALPKHKYVAPSQIQHSVPSQNTPTPEAFLDDRSDMKWMRRYQEPSNTRVSIGTILDDFGNFNVADYFDE